MTTLEMLAAHFGGLPIIPLESASPFWGYKESTLVEKIDAGEIRLPYFRLDEKQKAMRLAKLEDIAAIIDERHEAARTELMELWDAK